MSGPTESGTSSFPRDTEAGNNPFKGLRREDTTEPLGKRVCPSPSGYLNQDLTTATQDRPDGCRDLFYPDTWHTARSMLNSGRWYRYIQECEICSPARRDRKKGLLNVQNSLVDRPGDSFGAAGLRGADLDPRRGGGDGTASARAATSAPSPVTSAPELTATPGHSAATTALPANSVTPEATTNPVANARAAQGGPDAGTGDPDARAHDGVHTPDDRGNPDRGGDGTHSVTDPGTVDSDFHPVPRNAWGVPSRTAGVGKYSDQVQVGSPGFRKDLFGVPLVFSPDVHSEFGSAVKTGPRCSSIQRVEIAFPHPDGRHGPVHGASESKYGCMARGQLTVVFNLEVQDRQFLLPGPSLWRHTNPLPSRFMEPEGSVCLWVITLHALRLSAPFPVAISPVAAVVVHVKVKSLYGVNILCVDTHVCLLPRKSGVPHFGSHLSRDCDNRICIYAGFPSGGETRNIEINNFLPGSIGRRRVRGTGTPSVRGGYRQFVGFIWVRIDPDLFGPGRDRKRPQQVTVCGDMSPAEPKPADQEHERPDCDQG